MKPDTEATYDNENQLRLKSIAAFLKEYRLQSGLTQEQISLNAEINRSSVIRLEAAKPVSFITICKYVSGLDLDLNQVFLEIK